jgi:hypothetical protein
MLTVNARGQAFALFADLTPATRELRAVRLD